jgi:hypothetical protein
MGLPFGLGAAQNVGRCLPRGWAARASPPGGGRVPATGGKVAEYSGPCPRSFADKELGPESILPRGRLRGRILPPLAEYWCLTSGHHADSGHNAAHLDTVSTRKNATWNRRQGRGGRGRSTPAVGLGKAETACADALVRRAWWNNRTLESVLGGERDGGTPRFVATKRGVRVAPHGTTWHPAPYQMHEA